MNNAYRNSLIDGWIGFRFRSLITRWRFVFHWPLLLNAVPRGRFLKLIRLLLTAQQWMHFRHSCIIIFYTHFTIYSRSTIRQATDLWTRRRFFVGDTSSSPSTDRLMNGGHVTDAFINVKCGMNSSAGQSECIGHGSYQYLTCSLTWSRIDRSIDQFVTITYRKGFLDGDEEEEAGNESINSDIRSRPGWTVATLQ